MNRFSIAIALVLVALVLTCHGDGGKPKRGHRDNPRHRPPDLRKDGDKEMLNEDVKVHLLKKGCGIALFKDFGDKEESCDKPKGKGDDGKGKPGGGEGKPGGGEGKPGGGEGKPGGGEGKPGGGEGKPGGGEGKPGGGEGKPGGGKGPDKNDTMDDSKCFRSRRTHPVQWFPAYLGSGDSKGMEVSTCDEIKFKDVVCDIAIENDVAVQPQSNVMAVKGTLNATLPNDEKLTVLVYIIKNNGTVTVGNEVTEVYKGMVKFSIDIQGIEACNDSETLRMGLKVKARGKPSKKMNNGNPGKLGPRPPRFELGGGAEVIMSTMVDVDNKVVQLIESPEIKPEGDVNLVIPKGGRFLYDPEIEAGDELYEDEEEEMGNGDTNSVDRFGPSFVLMAFVLMFKGL